MGVWTLLGDFTAFDEAFYSSELTTLNSSKRLVVVSDVSGNSIELRGSGFTYENGALVGGLIKSVTLATFDGSGEWSGTQLNLDLGAYQGFGYPIDLAEMDAIGLVILSGNDSIKGSAGFDWMIGGAGDDMMKGNEGQDVLFVFGGGRDKLAGGAGADEFVFTSNKGTDRIRDFADLGTAQDDQITVSQRLYDKMSMEQVGGNVLLSFGNAGTLLLQNIDMAQIGADDFRIGMFWDLQG